jgi:hypothetical protein
LHKDVVAGFPNGRQIVDEGAGPVEDNVANHGGKLTAVGERHKNACHKLGARVNKRRLAARTG